MSKKAFDFARNSVYSVDPEELVIYGLDTAGDNTDHPLHDERINLPLEEPFIANIDAYGVMQTVLITKIDGKPFLVDGRQRVRAARIVNERRKKRGEPTIKVQCTIRSDGDAGLLGAMIATNEARQDDGPLAKAEKARRLLNRGVSEADAATTFAVSVQTLRGWLELEGASKEVKAAVKAGNLSASAAAKLATVKDHDKQREALAKVQAAPGKKKTVKAAEAAAKGAQGKRDNTGITSRKDLRALLGKVRQAKEQSDANAVLKGASNDWHAKTNFLLGVETVLEAVLGDLDLGDFLKRLE